MDLSTRLNLLTFLALIGVTIAVTMNTCAMDRLERQVIRVAKSVEKLEEAGGGNAPLASAGTSRAPASAAIPGTGTGYTAIGWGGKAAEITHVEGASAGAPLRLADKPLNQGDTYINRRADAPGSLNYYTTNEGATATVTGEILGRMLLVDPDKPPEVIPDLAVSWKVSDDKLTYTFQLRKGVQFADGRPFTAADVKFSYDVAMDPAVQADHLRGTLEDVVSLETPDDHTVVIRYRKPYWRGIYSVGSDLRILNKGWYEEQIPVWAERLGIEKYATSPGAPGFGDVFNKMRIPPPGTGPYYFKAEDYDPKVPVEIVQNPFYYGIQVHPEWWNLRSMKWIYISDTVAAFEAFRKETFDVSTVEFDKWDDELSKDAGIRAMANYYEYDHMALGFYYVAWNNREPPFDDPRVRKAMTHLTDRQWLVDELTRGRGQVARCPSKPSYPDYPPGEAIAHDIDAAKALLAEAGWTDSDGDGILDREGERFEFELKLGTPLRFYNQMAAQLGDATKKVGIRMTTRNLEWSTFIDDMYERRFDAVALYGSFPDPWIDQYGFHSSQDVPRGENTPGWRNAEVDQLVTEMREEFDADKRNKMAHRFCAIWQEEQPMTLLIHGMVGVLQHKRFEGVKVRPTGLRAHTFWVKPENVLHD